MAYLQYLKFNTENLPFPDSYDIDYGCIEADSSGETEAGTTQRDVIRNGIVSISVSFSVTKEWLKKLSDYAKLDKIAVQYFDTSDLALKQTEMYIDGFKAKLVKDTSYKGLWQVSFSLNEF